MAFANWFKKKKQEEPEAASQTIEAEGESVPEVLPEPVVVAETEDEPALEPEQPEPAEAKPGFLRGA
ncbi:MAG: hypothetical protein KC910_26790, partial [Candidatus Eremiobacteraeota bacterium]|nr:hypothetical protein [Candidatus Eremiobacteraeota bacterium]